MKKVLSLVLVIAMVLSSMSFAFAAKFEDIADTDYTKAIETLTALGVVTGYEDGTYRPEKVVTRAEMAKLMVEILGYGDLVVGSKSNFADTQGHWADPWIALAAGKNIVIGTGDGKFTPDRTVSYDEAITMVVRTLGYTDSSNEMASMTWPTNFKVKAAELDLLDGVEMSTSGADRGGVAQLLYNALEVLLVTVNSDGDIVESDKELLSRIADLDEDYEVTTEVLDADNSNYGGALVDLAPYIFQNLDVYLNDDDEVVYVRGTNSLILDGTVDEVVGLVLTVETTAGKDVDVTFASTAIDNSLVFENGSIKDTDIVLGDLEDTETIKVVANDKKTLGGDGDGKVDADEIVGFYTTLRTDVVRIEKEYVAGKDSIDGIDLPLNDDDELDFANINVTGDATELEDIAIDDIVVVYESEDEEVITLVVSKDAVEGKVTREYDGDTFYIDGKSYDLASMSLVSSLKLGDEGTFFLDQFGEIADYDGSSEGPTDYAVIISSANGLVDERFGLSIDTYPEVKLVNQDGEEVVYELALELKSTGVVDDTVVIDDADFFVGPYADNQSITITGKYDPAKAYLVKYSVDSDGRIDEIETVAEVTAYETAGNNLADIDLDKSTNTLVDGVVVFDATDADYDVVDADILPTKFEAYAVKNDDGEIEVLVVKAGELDTAADRVYAYINRATLTYNNDGDKVMQYVVYVNGAKLEILTDDDASMSVATYNKAISFKYTGEVIDDSTVDVNVADEANVATATAINARGGMIKLDIAAAVGHATTGENWYALSDNATIIEIDSTVDSTPNSVNGIKDLYDINEDDVVTVYVNADGEIDLIVIVE